MSELAPWMAVIAAWLAAFAFLGAAVLPRPWPLGLRLLGVGLVFCALCFVALGALLSVAPYLEPGSLWAGLGRFDALAQ